jgi:prevent-host-death family protein
MTWQLAEAKNKFSEVVDKALTKGPQRITRRGKDTVVLISAEEYDRLKEKTDGRESFIEYLMNGPSLKGLDLTRSRELPRDVEL